MRGFIGIVVSFILLIVLVSWLRLEGSKLITPNLRNAFNFSTTSSTTSTAQSGGSGSTFGSDLVSPYVGNVVITAVSLGSYRSATIQNNGIAQIPLSTWKLTSKKGTITIPRGNTRGNISGSATPIILAAGQTAVIFEKVRNEQAVGVRPNADWYAWTGSQFFEDKGELVLSDEKGREVATFSY